MYWYNKKKYNRCKNRTEFLFCKEHNGQWIKWIIATPGFILLLFTILLTRKQLLDDPTAKSRDEKTISTLLNLRNIFITDSFFVKLIVRDTSECTLSWHKLENKSFYECTSFHTTVESITNLYDKNIQDKILSPMKQDVIILGEFDSIELDGKIQIMAKVKTITPHKCSYTIDRPYFIEEYIFSSLVIEQINTPYLPSTVVDELRWFKNLYFQPMSLNRALQNGNGIFLLFSHGHIHSIDGTTRVYEILSSKNDLTTVDFIEFSNHVKMLLNEINIQLYKLNYATRLIILDDKGDTLN